MNTKRGLEMHHLMFILEKKIGPEWNTHRISQTLRMFDIFMIVPHQYVTCWQKYGIPQAHINEL